MSVDDEPAAHAGSDVTGSTQSLRQRAQAAVPRGLKMSLEQFSAMSPLAAQQMLCDLQVHQIDLEMQNEELRRLQAELDTSQARYFDFYDLAPVGYCTLTDSGLRASQPRGRRLAGRGARHVVWAGIDPFHPAGRSGCLLPAAPEKRTDA